MAVLSQKKPTTVFEKLNDETWRRKFLRNVVIPWIFIAPLLLIHIYVVAIPAVQGVYMSLTDWKGVGMNVNYVGLENYRELFFEDETFGKALGNNVAWMIFFLTVPFIMALFCATQLALSRIHISEPTRLRRISYAVSCLKKNIQQSGPRCGGQSWYIY